ncbi:bacillithiol system redox-active protein YtxJ [Dyadobacter psychrotolerans]|uniref:Bacillithiol system redox-active protein YtxJ n=1 Tax=Dyadobacter psychrotolerans TaxID=2541721 RepID=A0A4R5DEP3_9BACT|nr:bacillithiol system redox-active protein YtxJ [Dyadobacter psychrotolerans]TDE10214.1 bacillithiol system redox-active protein YtxJ [Dyadobacter psychrotolerans]
MNWIAIKDEDQIQDIFKSEEYSIIYKHSPRCMTSLMAYRQLKSEVSGVPDVEIPLYIVDVISNRRESQLIAGTFLVQHESPQILVVKKGICVFNTSHENVSLQIAMEHIDQVA